MITNGLLEDCTKDTPEFSLCGLTLQGRVLSLYDGDTMKIALPLHNSFYKFTCRLNGIDTCETHSKNVEVKDKALTSKYRIIELLTKDYNPHYLIKVRELVHGSPVPALRVYIQSNTLGLEAFPCPSPSPSSLPYVRNRTVALCPVPQLGVILQTSCDLNAHLNGVRVPLSLKDPQFLHFVFV
jgi:hypothetical protein